MAAAIIHRLVRLQLEAGPVAHERLMLLFRGPVGSASSPLFTG